MNEHPLNKKKSNMKNCISFLLLITFGLSSCVPAGSTTTPTQTDTPIPLPTLLSPTSTPTFTPIKTSTATLPATLEPEQAEETIGTLLQKPVDCSDPCFWGIRPGQTTFTEATNVFAFLGLQLHHTGTQNNKEFYETIYQTGKELEFDILLGVQDSIVKTLDVGMTDTSEVATSRIWTAYSPDTLIQRYGSPSRVEFSLGRVENPSHTMTLYFESAKMIILYLGNWKGFLKNPNTLELCPLINKVDFIEFWMGEEPRNPPPPDVPLEKATSLTIEDFSKLMMGDPNKACFNLRNEAFPQ